ncbi:MAG TPA: DUF1684 domain-containing protein [Candidatus Angelobacter sp.]|nr:DUF1684 domain-containing protein [Candidatus Angelobacter sp.]
MIRAELFSRTGLALLAFALCARFGASGVSPYEKSVEDWRQKYEAKLRADDGWLTVSGLFWLHEGKNTFGSAAGNDVVLPSPVPAAAGYFELHGGKTTVHVNPGVAITMAGQPVETAELRPDSKVDRLVIGDLTFFVHASGPRFGIRLKDKNSKLRKEFTGLRWFPIDARYHVIARFTPYASPRSVEIETILGDREKTELAGYVTFQLGGKEFRLDAEKQDDPEGLFIVFRDLTSRKDTYQAARFLDTDLPKDGTVEIDFNKAYNPPCAYNPYSTCPLPSPGNRMQIEIPAGEKRYH